MRQLREKALTVAAHELDLVPTERRPRVWGAVMELGYPIGIATLMALAEGTTSLYFSGGGGVIGAGEHESVREAAEAFLDCVERHLGDFEPIEGTPTPRIGRVRFYVRTFDRTLGREATEDELANDHHPLAPVYHAGHAVIAAIRVTQESGGNENGRDR